MIRNAPDDGKESVHHRQCGVFFGSPLKPGTGTKSRP